MIPIKSEKEIQIITANGRILASIMKDLEKKVEPGISTEELDRVAETLILNSGGTPSFKGYDGFPKTLCTSINEEVVHGIPSLRTLKQGDILSLDIGMKCNGFHVDMAVTVAVGKISLQAQRLIWITKKSLKRGIKKVKSGNTFGDIGNTIQRYVEDQGLGVVRELCGHGIGQELHEDPQILNYGKRHAGDKIQEGMVFCLEPMVTIGDWKIEEMSDGFCYKTVDNSLSAHFEHTIALTKDGCKILTI
ncbi:MAG: type I methionyl aminopeptidase [Patescibacteria group bacterium]|nr:type I methionyl aminopeptidase [Patescibacteria group bacterium]MBU1876949.1 type I methionyl aminopeptidase [Patescibacteria group bacterium]